MAKKTILVIDDEKDLIELVRYNLEKEGHDVVGATDGASGLEIARRHAPDLALLDLMMPGTDGLEVCRKMRSDDKMRRIPIIMLTAKADEADRVVGLEMGADDYITKPFSPRELVARVKALLRRTGEQLTPSDMISRHGLSIDLKGHDVSYKQKRVTLTATEFRILLYLAERPGRVLTRDDIIDGALNKDVAVVDRAIDVHLASIRKKLGNGGKLIETVRGFGYKFLD